MGEGRGILRKHPGGMCRRNCWLRGRQSVQLGPADLAPLGSCVATVRPSAAQANQPRRIIGPPRRAWLLQRNNMVHLHRIRRYAPSGQAQPAQPAVTLANLGPRSLPSGCVADACGCVCPGRSGWALWAGLAALVQTTAPLAGHQHQNHPQKIKKGTVRPMWAACSCRDSMVAQKNVAQSQILDKIKGPANVSPGLMGHYFVLSRCIRSAQACKM